MPNIKEFEHFARRTREMTTALKGYSKELYAFMDDIVNSNDADEAYRQVKYALGALDNIDLLTFHIKQRLINIRDFLNR
jgi:hypothetical protein